MDEWLNCLLEVSPNVQVLIVGNKIDSANRKVKSEDILHYAAANQFEAIECSAKSGENISEVFCKAAVVAYKTINAYNGSVKVIHILFCVCFQTILRISNTFLSISNTFWRISKHLIRFHR